MGRHKFREEIPKREADNLYYSGEEKRKVKVVWMTWRMWMMIGVEDNRLSSLPRERVKRIRGIDISPGMIKVCKEKLTNNKIAEDKGYVVVGDITEFALNETFDLIIAPFRVIQNIEDSNSTIGLLQCIGKHLSSGGSSILNAFNPKWGPEEMRKKWCYEGEKLQWERNIDRIRITCSAKQTRMNEKTLALYPELIYRKY